MCGDRGTWNLSVFSVLVYCDYKTALKIKFINNIKYQCDSHTTEMTVIPKCHQTSPHYLNVPACFMNLFLILTVCLNHVLHKVHTLSLVEWDHLFIHILSSPSLTFFLVFIC